MTLTTLYKKSATGALWQWRTWSNGATKYEEWGQCGGKLQTSEDTVREGKNLGKANATTPETQAHAELVSAWEHKIKSGYVESREDALAGKTALGGYAPMLAKSAADVHSKYLTFPCYVQPKFDGMRCQSPLDGLYSRTRKPLNFPHIAAEIARIRQTYRWLANAEFDGELYLHKFSANFQDLMSICRKENHPQQHIIEYWVYDIIDPARNFSDRYGAFAQIDDLTGPVKVVPTILCENQEQVDAAEQRFVEEGYEGAMRRSDAPYEFKRSANLLKIKRFQDEEFEIIDIIEGRGKLTGHAGSLKFATAEGKEFFAKPALPDLMLHEIFNRPNDLLHRQATVKYQGKSNDGIPRFPVVKDIL